MDMQEEKVERPKALADQSRKASEKEITLDRRIGRLPKILQKVLRGYLEMDSFPFLKVLCEMLELDYMKVEEAIQRQDADSKKEPFSALLLDIERHINKRRGVFLRETVFQIAQNSKWEKDKLAAAKLWFAEVRSSETDEADEGSRILQPDGLFGIEGQMED